MPTWCKGKNPQARAWHYVTETTHFHQEYKNGTVVEGDDVRTLCYPNGYNLLDHVTLFEGDTPPGPMCKLCAMRLGNRDRF